MRSYTNEDFEDTSTPGLCVWCKAENPQYLCSLLTQYSPINRVHLFCDQQCYRADRTYRGYTEDSSSSSTENQQTQKEEEV